MLHSVRERATILVARIDRRVVRRAALALGLACAVTLVVTFVVARQRMARATARLELAAQRLDALTDGDPVDDRRRAAIAWGYGKRLDLGLESPFRLVEAAARDPRLTADGQRTVSWALLAHIVRGESHRVDAAVLDGIGPAENGRSPSGEQHLTLIDAVIAAAGNPRAAELGVRFAYTLAAAERLVDGSAPGVAAEVAALRADGAIARREATSLVRAAGARDPIEVVRRRRAGRGFYVERPALLAPGEELEGEALRIAASLLDSLRGMHAMPAPPPIASTDADERWLAPRLFAAGLLLPPAAPLAVTVKRYEPMMRAHATLIDAAALERTRNAEMLVAVTRATHATRSQRRAIARLILAAAVSMRSSAQERVWFAGDTVASPATVAGSIGVAAIVFDSDVPSGWRPYFLQSLADGVSDLRRVLPALRLDGVHVRFRMSAPADSALAMHDPRSRTLHLPASTWGGTLSHELAHDLDRQSALGYGLAGYRSDIVARVSDRATKGRGIGTGRLAASLRAVTEELSELPRPARAIAERPAEIFATRVDWFVAQALAHEGISSGFLSAVQDELLTGHVVHPERLRSTGRSRSLITALQEMTPVVPFALEPREPGVQTLLRWALTGPVDRRVAADIIRGESRAWLPARLVGDRSCGRDVTGRAELVRMAAESRARGWLRLRARWTADSARAPWAKATLRQHPWASESAERRVAELRDYLLIELASVGELPTGLGGYAAPIALRARCGN